MRTRSNRQPANIEVVPIVDLPARRTRSLRWLKKTIRRRRRSQRDANRERLNLGNLTRSQRRARRYGVGMSKSELKAQKIYQDNYGHLPQFGEAMKRKFDWCNMFYKPKSRKPLHIMRLAKIWERKKKGAYLRNFWSKRAYGRR